MIKSVALYRGANEELYLTPLLVTSSSEFKTVQEFIATFRASLEKCCTPKETFDGVFFRLCTRSIDRLGQAYLTLIEDGWELGNLNEGPFIQVYNAQNAIEDQTNYEIFYLDGTSEFIHED